MWYASLDSPTPSSRMASGDGSGGQPLDQEEGRRFADRQAVTIPVERTARSRRRELKRVEAVQRREAQRVHAADDRRIDQAGLDHPRGRTEDLRARRARRRNRCRGPAQLQRTPHEIGNGERILRRRIKEIAGQRSGHGIAPPVRELGLKNARSTRADEYANPVRAVSCAGRRHARDEVVLREAQRRESIVAAVEVGDRGGQPHGVDTGNLADAGVDIHRFEAAGREPAALLAQCVEVGRQSAAEAGRRSELG